MATCELWNGTKIFSRNRIFPASKRMQALESYFKSLRMKLDQGLRKSQCSLNVTAKTSNLKKKRTEKDPVSFFLSDDRKNLGVFFKIGLGISNYCEFDVMEIIYIYSCNINCHSQVCFMHVYALLKIPFKLLEQPFTSGRRGWREWEHVSVCRSRSYLERVALCTLSSRLHVSTRCVKYIMALFRVYLASRISKFLTNT